jgi:hypothetical protein
MNALITAQSDSHRHQIKLQRKESNSMATDAANFFVYRQVNKISYPKLTNMGSH